MSLIVLLSPAAQGRRISFQEVFKLVTASQVGSNVPQSPLLDLDYWRDYRSQGPLFFDPKNDYARWGSRQELEFTELAVWRTTNGKAIIGLNLAGHFVEGPCGDGPCGPQASFVGFDGTRFQQVRNDTAELTSACKGDLETLLNPKAGLDRSLRVGIAANFRKYAPKLIGPQAWDTRCFFPQHGTSVTVAVHPEMLAFAYRDQVLPVFYFKFDKVKGTFSPSLLP